MPRTRRSFSKLSVMALTMAAMPSIAFSPDVGPSVAIDLLGATELEILVADDAAVEILDVEVAVTPHDDAARVRVLDPSSLVVAGSSLPRPEKSFRVDLHLLVAVASESGPEILGEVVHRAYFLCSTGTCSRVSFSDYMVGTGKATRDFDDEGKLIVSLQMTRLGGAQ